MPDTQTPFLARCIEDYRRLKAVSIADIDPSSVLAHMSAIDATARMIADAVADEAAA